MDRIISYSHCNAPAPNFAKGIKTRSQFMNDSEKHFSALASVKNILEDEIFSEKKVTKRKKSFKEQASSHCYIKRHHSPG